MKECWIRDKVFRVCRYCVQDARRLMRRNGYFSGFVEIFAIDDEIVINKLTPTDLAEWLTRRMRSREKSVKVSIPATF